MPELHGHILVVDDEPNIRKLLAGVLEDEGYRVSSAVDAAAARAELATCAIDLVLLDVQLPGQDGLSFLRDLQESTDPAPPVIMMSGHGTIATAVEATRLGALDFIEKPIQAERLLLSVANGLRLQLLSSENIDLRAELDETRQLIGSSDVMADLRRQIAQAGPAEARVLITGENGTGKELIARALHAASRRRRRPLIKVNCAAIPAELLESELFGHERGAFTGAVSRRLGKFERAQGGTLLLDEIGDMNPTTQAKLLRVLEEGELERVGGSGTVALDVRIFASTNRDLERLRREGAFREDLFHRLKVIPVHAPALRDHPDDIPELADHYLRHFCRTGGRPALSLTPAALERLSCYRWPGNVRELKNLMERIMIMVPDREVSTEVLDELLPETDGDTAHDEADARDTAADHRSLADRLTEQERLFIAAALERNDGNVAGAARDLGVDRANLHRRLKRLGLRS